MMNAQAGTSALRVVQLCSHFPPSRGGIQYYVQNLADALAAAGHDSTVLSIQTEPGTPIVERMASGTRVVRCRPVMRYHRGVISPELSITVVRVARQADVLHVHAPFHFGLEAAAAAAILAGKPLVVTHHGEDASGGGFYSAIARTYIRASRLTSLRAARRIVVLTESYRAALAFPPPLASRTSIVRTGADVVRFHPDVNGSMVRRRHGMPPEASLALFVGNLSEHNRYKGVDHLISAMRDVRLAHPAARLVIVGGGALVEEYQRLAKTVGVEREVVFAGEQTNDALPGYYAAADLFVLPSIRGPENSPVVLFEAMASATPFVASDLPGVREIAAESHGGNLVPPGDVPALATAMSNLFADPARRQELAASGIAYARKRAWPTVAAEMVALYCEAGAANPSSAWHRLAIRRGRRLA